MAKGLKLGSKKKPMIDVKSMNIPEMLSKQLNISPEEVMQLLTQVKDAKSPQEAVMIIKAFDKNPQTMNQQMPAVQAPTGLQMGK